MDVINPELLKEQLNEAKFAELSVEEVDGKQVFVATDETIDREGEVLSIDGWDLGNFKRNPILLWSHNPFEPMIGRASNIRRRTVGGKQKLVFEPEFHRKSELSKLIADLVDEGWMKTVSVGFRPYEKDKNRYTKQELLEISFVNIPANPEATQLAFSKGYSTETVKQLFGDDIEVKSPEDMDGMKPRMEKMEQRMSTMEGRMDDMESMMRDMKQVNQEEVAEKANPTIESGRSDKPVDKAVRQKRLVQLANKALSAYLHSLK